MRHPKAINVKLFSACTRVISKVHEGFQFYAFTEMLQFIAHQKWIKTWAHLIKKSAEKKTMLMLITHYIASRYKKIKSRRDVMRGREC